MPVTPCPHPTRCGAASHVVGSVAHQTCDSVGRHPAGQRRSADQISAQPVQSVDFNRAKMVDIRRVMEAGEQFSTSLALCPRDVAEELLTPGSYDQQMAFEDGSQASQPVELVQVRERMVEVAYQGGTHGGLTIDDRTLWAVDSLERVYAIKDGHPPMRWSPR